MNPHPQSQEALVTAALQEWTVEHGDAPSGKAWSVVLDDSGRLVRAVLVNAPGFSAPRAEVFSDSAPSWYGADEASAWAAGWNACRQALFLADATAEAES